MPSIARGIRNNNPGNIDYNPRNQWQGQVGIVGKLLYGLLSLAAVDTSQTPVPYRRPF